jgi:hypothetical protein
MKDFLINKINDVWFGRERLWRVFWIYNVLIGSILGIAVEGAIIHNKSIEKVIVLSVYTVYNIWVLKGLYECRKNAQNQTFIPYLMLGFVYLNSILLFYGITQILLKKVI